MKRGLVIGKFMPIHSGHLALIRFAKKHCDELIVSMSFTSLDSIDPQLRFGWLKELLKSDPQIIPEISLDDFDNEKLELKERTQIWADFIRRRFPPVDIIFSSEEYGKSFAENLGIEDVLFDPDRKQVPVSATKIRNKPFQFWQFIPEVVRPYFVKKICFYGPESTGKSTMAVRMAARYETEFVPEVAREMITSNDFSLDDIIRIGHAQTERVKEKAKTANKILFCDSDLITTQIYSQHYLKTVPLILKELEKEIHYDLYFLFDIDVPWVADELRDLENRRSEMLEIFENELIKRNIGAIRVKGNWKQREELIITEIDHLLK
ncbi:transcriptional regulator NadR [Cytophagales bacterium WSM2-2]|nr:transcriptional regulator NadR [Cytophagales bacterium WSM2-2]